MYIVISFVFIALLIYFIFKSNNKTFKILQKIILKYYKKTIVTVIFISSVVILVIVIRQNIYSTKVQNEFEVDNLYVTDIQQNIMTILTSWGELKNKIESLKQDNKLIENPQWSKEYLKNSEIILKNIEYYEKKYIQEDNKNILITAIIKKLHTSYSSILNNLKEQVEFGIKIYGKCKSFDDISKANIATFDSYTGGIIYSIDDFLQELNKYQIEIEQSGVYIK